MDKHTFSYEHNDSIVVWDLVDIWKAVEDLPVSNVSIQSLKPLYNKVSSEYTEDDYARIEEADLNYPIILSKLSTSNKIIIVDGYHRIGKCLEERISNIKVKYIKKMPRPIYCKGKPFEIDGLDFDWYDPRKSSKK